METKRPLGTPPHRYQEPGTDIKNAVPLESPGVSSHYNVIPKNTRVSLVHLLPSSSLIKHRLAIGVDSEKQNAMAMARSLVLIVQSGPLSVYIIRKSYCKSKYSMQVGIIIC